MCRVVKCGLSCSISIAEMYVVSLFNYSLWRAKSVIMLIRIIYGFVQRRQRLLYCVTLRILEIRSVLSKFLHPESG